MANQQSRDNAPKLSKKRKLGKNKKKAWRVSKIEDIEEFLEDERQQLRAGGLISDKPDDALFVIDTSSKAAELPIPVSEDPVGPRSKRLRKDRPLKCLSHLLPDPHSKPVRTPDQPTFQKGKRTGRILERLRAREKSQTRLQAAKDSKKYTAANKVVLEQRKTLPTKAQNIWEDDDDAATEKVKSVKPPKNFRKKPSALPATVIPHPGASVNPSYEDHQALLSAANTAEVKKEREQKRLYNALDAKFPDKADAPNESTYLVEMSAGLVSDSEDEQEGDDSYLSINPPVRREDRKTKKQRRVEREVKQKAIEKTQMTTAKQREHEVLRLPTIKATINQMERKEKERAGLKRKQKEQEPYKTKRLNSIKFEEPDLDLKLSTELVGSYRELKPEGHLLKDIYKSVQRRNILEPRMKQKNKRTYKLKTFEKKGHKAVTL